jgi:hypothetical protein
MDVLDLVPTEGSTQWTTRYLPTSRRGVASRTSTRRDVLEDGGIYDTTGVMIIGRTKKVNAASKYRASHKPG